MIPIIFSDNRQQSKRNFYVLGGDIGATKVNLALYIIEGSEMNMVRSVHYLSRDHASFNEILRNFLSENDDKTKPESICIGVAGPVQNNKAALTNLSWKIDANELSGLSGVRRVALINDLEATAYGLACLNDNDLLLIHKGSEGNTGNAAIAAPGTGLGEAGLFWNGKFYYPFATEGGHSHFAPHTEIDIELYWYLKKLHDVVSCEHLISGPGIYTTYTFLRDIKNYEEPAWLAETFHKKDPSAAIAEAALENKAEICSQAMKLFVEYLAKECANLVLKFNATGGLYLGGGIAPKIAMLLQAETFIKNYLECDRMTELVDSVPVRIIMNDKAALLGAVYYGAYAPL